MSVVVFLAQLVLNLPMSLPWPCHPLLLTILAFLPTPPGIPYINPGAGGRWEGRVALINGSFLPSQEPNPPNFIAATRSRLEGCYHNPVCPRGPKEQIPS